MNGTLLLDVGALPWGCVDHVLEQLHKSLADPPGDSLLWRPHDNPYLVQVVEQSTAQIQAVLLAILEDLLHLAGIEPPKSLQKSHTPWLRWDAEKLARVRAYLDNKDPKQYGIDDWMTVIELIIQSHLPRGVILHQAEYLAVRSALMGKVQLAMGDHVPYEPEMRHMTGLLPDSWVSVRHDVPLAPIEEVAIDFARARAADLIEDLGDKTRHRVKQIIIDHQRAAVLGEFGGSLQQLQSRLLDEFGILNRDWRRIAITEATRNANEGFIAALPEGARVKRVEAYQGACGFCRAINGRIYTVVPPEKEGKNGGMQVWVGKTNVGRSASPRKRSGNELVERLPSEMWWPAAGAQHPNCRGSWQLVEQQDAGVSAEFVDWMDDLLGS